MADENTSENASQKGVFKQGVNTFRLNRMEAEILNGVIETLDSQNLPLREAVVLLGDESVSGKKTITKEVPVPDQDILKKLEEHKLLLLEKTAALSDVESINAALVNDNVEWQQFKEKFGPYLLIAQSDKKQGIKTYDDLVTFLLSYAVRTKCFPVTSAMIDEAKSLLNGKEG